MYELEESFDRFVQLFVMDEEGSLSSPFVVSLSDSRWPASPPRLNRNSYFNMAVDAVSSCSCSAIRSPAQKSFSMFKYIPERMGRENSLKMMIEIGS